MARESKKDDTRKRRWTVRRSGVGYDALGILDRHAARITWATVNKLQRGGKRSGSGGKGAQRAR